MSNPQKLAMTMAARRWWLLNKALENNCLCDALKIARAADEFIIGSRSKDRRPTDKQNQTSEICDGTKTQHKLNFTPQPSSPERDDLEDKSIEREEIVTAAERQASLPAVVKDCILAHSDDPIASYSVGNGSAEFGAWTSIAEVVRYLRRHDNVVITQGENTFLVNGRFRESLIQVVDRANKLRQRHQQPPFQLAPSIVATALSARIAGIT
jgi:hypothetical protein